MKVKSVTYVEVFGTYMHGFTKMDTHMAEMIADGWRVQSQNLQPAHKGLWGTKQPNSMIVTYIKD
jgi:hypothetical protein